MKSPEQKPILNIKKATPHPLAKTDKIFQELREAHWKNKEMIDREMLTKYPEVLDKRLDEYDGYLKDLVKINYPADEIDQVKQGLIDIKKLRQDYDQVWGSDKQDMDEAKKIKKQINTKLAELEVVFNQSISGRTPEGIEVSIDFQEQISYWNNFYQKYEIKDDQGEICQLSDNLRLTPEQINQAKQDIEKFGFDTILIIPKGVKNRDLLNNDRLLTYPENETKSTIDKRYIASDMPNDVLDATTTHTQIILLKNSPNVYQDVNWDSHNKTFKQVQTKEQELGIEGLDILSFLFFHRSYYDQTSKDGKGTHPHVWQKKQATWLTKTAIDDRFAEAYWDSDVARPDFYWFDNNYYLPFLGTVFSRSFEIEEKY